MCVYICECVCMFIFILDSTSVTDSNSADNFQRWRQRGVGNSRLYKKRQYLLHVGC